MPRRPERGERSAARIHAEHMAYLEELTPHLAVAIEKARLFEQATARARRSTRLAELSRLVPESLDAERVQQFVIQAAADLLGADLTPLFLLDRDGERGLAAVVATGDRARRGQSAWTADATRLRSSARSSGAAVLAPDAALQPRRADDPLNGPQGLGPRARLPFAVDRAAGGGHPGARRAGRGLPRRSASPARTTSSCWSRWRRRPPVRSRTLACTTRRSSRRG